MKLSVFYDHILQAAEQTGKNVPELLAEAKNAGIDAVEINMTYLNEHEETGRRSFALAASTSSMRWTSARRKRERKSILKRHRRQEQEKYS